MSCSQTGAWHSSFCHLLSICLSSLLFCLSFFSFLKGWTAVCWSRYSYLLVSPVHMLGIAYTGLFPDFTSPCCFICLTFPPFVCTSSFSSACASAQIAAAQTLPLLFRSLSTSLMLTLEFLFLRLPSCLALLFPSIWLLVSWYAGLDPYCAFLPVSTLVLNLPFLLPISFFIPPFQLLVVNLALWQRKQHNYIKSTSQGLFREDEWIATKRRKRGHVGSQTLKGRIREEFNTSER